MTKIVRTLEGARGTATMEITFDNEAAKVNYENDPEMVANDQRIMQSYHDANAAIVDIGAARKA